MNFITQTDLENFMGKFPKEGDTQPQEYCNSAMEAVEDYLGYNPELQTYTQTIKGDNGGLLSLKACHITEITEFKIGDEVHDPAELEIIDEVKNYVEFSDGSIFDKNKKYTVTYKAGWSTIPSIIKTTALQIASLFWESAGGNLAVSSTSFADTGSRVFNNFKMDRFLDQIEKYKRIF